MQIFSKKYNLLRIFDSLGISKVLPHVAVFYNVCGWLKLALILEVNEKECQRIIRNGREVLG